MSNHNSTWVVVTSEAEAKIFRLVNFPKIEEVATLSHPASRLRNTDLVSERPGRNFQSVGTNRNAYEYKSDPKMLEAEKFAKYCAEYLSTAREKGEFFRLYVLAGPSFLGLLRQHMDGPTKETIVAEIAKDLVHHPKADIEKQLVEI